MKKKLAITLLLALLLSLLLCAGALAARNCPFCNENSIIILGTTASGCSYECTNSGCLTFGFSIHIHAAPPCEWCGYVENPPACEFTGDVIPNNDGTHEVQCRWFSDCKRVITEACSGGKATCTKQAECEVCGAAYGKAGGHDYEAEVTAPTCTAEGYTLYTCRECGYSFKGDETDMLLHWFGRWTPNADGTHSAVCLRDGYTGTSSCFPLEVTAGESLVTVCPVCGESSAGTFEVVENACAEGRALPLGEFIVRGAAQPFDGALYAFTAAFEYSGEVQPFIRPLPVSLPVALTEEFTLVRVDVTPAAQGTERTEAWTEVPFTLENGTLTFEAENTALYLLLPLQNAAE